MKYVFKLCSIAGFTILIIMIALIALGPIILMRGTIINGDSSSMFTFMHYVGSYSGILLPLSIFLIFIGTFGNNFGNIKSSKNRVTTLGKIISVRDTGTIIKNKSQIEFTAEFLLPHGKKIRNTVINAMKAVDLNQFQSGMIVLVKYDQNNPEKMTIDWKASYEDLKKTQKRIQYYPGFTEMGFKI